VIEAMLYFLWDLALKVGHSSRSLDDTVRMAKSDITICTALLEGRYVWGDQALFDESRRRFFAEVVAGSERNFVTEKLAERNERHKRLGDSRYVVEPNVKEGKGGLRDLHTLYWIGKYLHKVRSPAELVDVGLLTQDEYRAFRRAESFFWAVRCHLHTITNRAEDRLTFDLQRQVAQRMAFADRPGKSAVERFMQYFFLQAKQVGSLTGVFLAQLEEQTEKKKRKGLLASFRGGRARSRVQGFPWPYCRAFGRLVRGRSGTIAGNLHDCGRGKFRDPPRNHAPDRPRFQTDRRGCAQEPAGQRIVHGIADQPP
jgi:[protein-PII] uridylyltransferase